MKEDKEKETKTNKEENNETGKFIRISIEADEALSSLHRRINGNADAVKVTKVMLASYVLEKHCPGFSDEDAKILYMNNVSEVDLLRVAYKRAIDSGLIPDNLREILFANAGLTHGSKKVKKPRQHNGSIATVDESEAS
jgi:hypothetical protein